MTRPSSAILARCLPGECSLMRRILASHYAIGDSILAEVFFKLGFLSFVAHVRAAGACNKFSALMAIAGFVG
jgi:hypothetical protein